MSVLSSVPQNTTDATRPRSRVVQITILALVVVWLSAYWIRQSEIVSIACQGSGSVPSVPGLAMLLLVLVINPVLRRTRIIRPVSLGESVLLYCIVTIGVMMYGVGGMRHLMAAMTESSYLSKPSEPTAKLAEFIPSWLVPTSAAAIRRMYEGSPRGMVPWDQWQVPVLAWTVFFPRANVLRSSQGNGGVVTAASDDTIANRGAT